MAIKCVAAIALLVACVIAPASHSQAGELPSFVIDELSGTYAPGDSFTVTGSGCPPTGAFPTGSPVRLLLSAGNYISPAIINGEVGVVSTAMGFIGPAGPYEEAGAEATPEPDGTFEASITIPVNTPAGAKTIRGLCLTVLEPGDDLYGFTQESYDASFTEAAITVQAPPTTVPPPDDPAPRGVQPAFAG
jgi:hypothetical protein